MQLEFEKICKKVKLHLRQVFSLDLKVLSFFRIALGAVIFFDTAQRLIEIPHFYCESGLYPKSILTEYLNTLPFYSKLFFISDDCAWPSLLLAITLIFCVFFILGIVCRYVTPILWFLLATASMRVPDIDHLGDQILLWNLFFSIFLPMDHQWALRQVANKARSRKYFSLASVAFVTQIVVFYLALTYQKFQTNWLSSNSVETSLLNMRMTSSFGEILLQFPNLLQFLTWTTFAIELSFPLIILLLPRTFLIRNICLLSLVLLHMGILFGMNLDFISVIAITSLLPLLCLEKEEKPALAENTPSLISRIVLVTSFSFFLVHVGINLCKENWPELSDLSVKMRNGSMISANFVAFSPVPDSQGWNWVKIIDRNDEARYYMPGCELDKNVESIPPENISTCYKNIRWYKYFVRFESRSRLKLKILKKGLGAYFCHFAGGSQKSVELWERSARIRNGQTGPFQSILRASVPCDL